MNHDIIIGLGTGRCGTNTLARILSDNGVLATHEAFTFEWEFNHVKFNSAAKCFEREECVSDVGFYWVNYADSFIKLFPKSKFVCLKRDKDKVIASFDRKTPHHNWWTDPDSDYWDGLKWHYTSRMKMMPKYNAGKIDAIARYYDDYYFLANGLFMTYPNNFKIYNTDEVLNDEYTQEKMFKFIGIDKPCLITGKKYNESFREDVIAERKTYYGNPVCIVCDRPATHDIHDKDYSLLLRACDDCVAEKLSEINGYYHNTDNRKYVNI
jgi:hypothetical protein